MQTRVGDGCIDRDSFVHSFTRSLVHSFVHAIHLLRMKSGPEAGSRFRAAGDG